jgi:hypothetical protein
MDTSVPNTLPQSLCHYFVDEAGDPVLFNEKGKVLIGQIRHPELRFFAVVRDKGRGILSMTRTYRNRRYKPNEQYDDLVRRLFKGLLHKEKAYAITFASRGTRDRTQALSFALEEARRRFAQRWNIDSQPMIQIRHVPAYQEPCLQAADYLLWALQRCYEKREDRYLEYVWPLYHLIIDVDDRRQKQTGMYYSQREPLKLDHLQSLWVWE